MTDKAIARVETTVLETPAKELEEHFTVRLPVLVLFLGGRADQVLLTTFHTPR